MTTVVWEQIRSRLHEESGLQNPSNEVGKLLDIFIGTSFESFEDFIDEHLLQSFILLAEGDHLDRLGYQEGVTRKDNETDSSYRQRIMNQLESNMTVVNTKRQGIDLYSKKNVGDNSRLYLTSTNAHTNNKYDAIPKTSEAKTYLLQQLLYEYILQPHWKGY